MSSLAFATGAVRAAGRSTFAPHRRAQRIVVRAENKPASATAGLWDVLAFAGPAPERINGRLAMAGFVSVLAMEASTRGDGLLAQVGSGTSQAWFAYAAATLTVASLVPLLQGETAEAWNGRLAMLGLVVLAVTKYLTGAPFISA